MQEKAIVYFVVAWLSAWVIDLVMVVARGPVLIDPIIKLIVVLICLIIVLVTLARANWLL
jgi:hypothetical protein